MDSKDRPQLRIFGPRKLQNRLLARFLEEETGIEDCVNGKIAVKKEREGGHPTKLLLWDCLKIDLDGLRRRPAMSMSSKSAKHLVVLFNVSSSKGLEYEAIRRGIRGVFYETDPPPLLARGVTAVTKGQLWFPRSILIDFLSTSNDVCRSDETRPLLSFREIEVLRMLTYSLRNVEIGEKLCISEYTVRAHLRSIYRKINATNRLEAVLWASDNL